MADQFEQSLREVLSQRAGQFDHDSIARLQAIDYHPRRRRVPKWPTVGVVGVGGTAAVAAAVALVSGAAPAFAGWKAAPTPPKPGQLAQADQACGAGLGTPVLTDTRGPYTAAIYATSTTGDLCLSGNGVSLSSSSSSAAPVSVDPGQIQPGGGGMRDSAGNALTMVDGRTGAGVTAVTIDLSDGTSVQATVAGGWYLAWWPGSVTATNAQVTSSSGTSTVAFPSTPTLEAPACPSGAQCRSGYSFGSGNGQASSAGGGSMTQSGSTSSR
jgi:hypothetical protein